MADGFDLLIRNGLVVDGTGAEPREADVAISGGRIAAVGKLSGSAREASTSRCATTSTARSIRLWT
jgi:N-acyl-D-amino-acid deacylase